MIDTRYQFFSCYLILQLENNVLFGVFSVSELYSPALEKILVSQWIWWRKDVSLVQSPLKEKNKVVYFLLL